MIMRGITRYIEDLVRSRRPRRFRAREDDIGIARTAITLRAARPGTGDPAEEFVTALHEKLAAEINPPAAPRAVGARRTFLRTATVAGAAAAGAAVAGAGIDHVLTSRAPSGSSPLGVGTLKPGHGIWRTVAASTDLPEGAVRTFTADAVTGFVERVNGQVRAVSGVCTHQGCLLAFTASPAHLVCPCHGATFALDGVVLAHKFPFPLPALPRIEVREANGDVQVYVPRPGL
jgi:nitrite reductase/ring-hydroxylating ferredoxin subunit